MPKAPVIHAISDYYPLAPAEDGSRLYLRVPPELAKQVEVVKLAPKPAAFA
jgi:hypothetical protein